MLSRKNGYHTNLKAQEHTITNKKAIKKKERHQRFYVVQQFAYIHGAHRTQSTTFRVDYNLSVSLKSLYNLLSISLPLFSQHTLKGLHNVVFIWEH